MAATHEIAIIGASFGGLPVAHGLLKDILPPLTATTKQPYKVTMISPSDHFWWKVGAPRVIANPNAIPVEKALLYIPDGFTAYSPEQFEFVMAYVESIDPTAKTLRLSNSRTIKYDSLVIASGTSFASPLWSTSNGYQPLADALKDIHERIPVAQSILVAGGGPAGVETTGELGELYGGKKELTILSGSKRLLPRLTNIKISADAEARLTKMGVTVINDSVRVTSHRKEGGKEILQLSDGTTKTVDVYIDASGDKPNSQFVPAAWLNEKGFVRSDGQTLRLDVPGVTGVYVFGSVGSYSDGAIMDTKFAIKPMLETLKLDLQGQEPGPRSKNVYKKFTSELQIVPIGSQGGVGVMFGWRAPSFAVKMIKAKDFFIKDALKLVQGTA